MKTLIIVTIVMISIIASDSAQDREIGNARARMTTVLAASIPGITYADLFNTRSLPALGWNWDTPISQFNDLSFAHTLHVGYRYPWTDANGLINGFGTRFRDSSTNDPNQTVWLYPHVDGSNGELAENSAGGAEEVKCLRYDPEINVSLTNFTPTASASPGAVFGFRYKNASVTNANSRISLEAADYLDDDTTLVLADVWPDSAMMQRFQNGDFNGTQDQDRSGRQMLLSVNLRRAAGSSSTQDTMPIAILRLKYHTFADAQGIVDSGYVFIDSLLDPNDVILLNANDPSYGQTCDYVAAPALNTTFTIRRHHLPATGDRNLSAWINFPFKRQPTGNRPLTHLYGRDNSETSDYIRTLDIEVYYVTNANDTSDTDVEIDWIKLETPHARDYLSGLDSAAFLDEHVEFMQDLNRFNTEANRTFRIDSWYAHDEAMMMYWEGWRHFNRLLDSNSISEIGCDYARHLVHKVGVRRLWQGTTGGPTAAATPYYRFGYMDNGGNPFIPNEFLGYRLGTEMQEEHWPQQHEGGTAQFVHVDYDTHWGDKPSASEPGKFSVELPIPDTLYDDAVVSANLHPIGTSPLTNIEAYLWRYFIRIIFFYMKFRGLPTCGRMATGHSAIQHAMPSFRSNACQPVRKCTSMLLNNWLLVPRG